MEITWLPAQKQRTSLKVESRASVSPQKEFFSNNISGEDPPPTHFIAREQRRTSRISRRNIITHADIKLGLCRCTIVSFGRQSATQICIAFISYRKMTCSWIIGRLPSRRSTNWSLGHKFVLCCFDLYAREARVMHWSLCSYYAWSLLYHGVCHVNGDIIIRVWILCARGRMPTHQSRRPFQKMLWDSYFAPASLSKLR